MSKFRDQAFMAKSGGVHGSDAMFLASRVGPVRGEVKIWVDDGFGNILHHHDPNVVVNGARTSLAHLIAEADGDYQVTTFKVGGRGHVIGPPEDYLTPVAPSVNDLGLVDIEPYVKAIDMFVYAPEGAETSVVFTTILQRNEANGEDTTGTAIYTEAGLFTSNGLLFARETFPIIVKNNGRRATFEWTIFF